jgi:hypothetical protein
MTATKTATARVYVTNDIFAVEADVYAQTVFTVLNKYASSKTGRCQVAHETIRALTGFAVSRIKDALAELARVGLLAVEACYRGGERQANVYTVSRDFSRGFFTVYADFFRKGLSAKARGYYLCLCHASFGRRRVEGLPHSLAAARCKLSVQSIYRAGLELAAKGIIKLRERFYALGGQRENEYELTAIAEHENTAEPDAITPENAACASATTADGRAETVAAALSLPQKLMSLLHRSLFRVVSVRGDRLRRL